MKILSTIIYCMISSYILAQSQQDISTATRYYNSAVELLRAGNYLVADSIFTLSLNNYPATDAYYNRALTRKKLGNEKGFCYDLYMSTADGDTAVRNLYLKKCTINDTTYIDLNNEITDKKMAVKTKIIAKHKYDSNKDIVIDSLGRTIWYHENNAMVNDTMVLSQNGSFVVFNGEIMPSFPGGEAKLLSFLSNNVEYPSKSKKNRIEGRVYVTFVITNNGKIEDIKIIRGLNDEIDNEALRVVRLMPEWNPGMQDGRYVNVHYNLPINFNLR